jgi:hypothetical protein
MPLVTLRYWLTMIAGAVEGARLLVSEPVLRGHHSESLTAEAACVVRCSAHTISPQLQAGKLHTAGQGALVIQCAPALALFSMSSYCELETPACL